VLGGIVDKEAHTLREAVALCVYVQGAEFKSQEKQALKDLAAAKTAHLSSFHRQKWAYLNSKSSTMSALQCYIHEEHEVAFPEIKKFFAAFEECVVDELRKNQVFRLVIPHWGGFRLKAKTGCLKGVVRLSDSERYVTLSDSPYDLTWCDKIKSPNVTAHQKASRSSQHIALRRFSLKRRFVMQLCQRSGTDLKTGAWMFDCFLSHLAVLLRKGRRFTWRRLGTFGVRRRKARVGMNPATGESLHIPARIEPSFRIASNLKARFKAT
jgi:nucleoid DNA-binding protein